MQPMYPGKVNSPQTELASAIDDEQTTIPLLDASVLPAAPNLATIGTGENAETVLYTGINGNDLTGVTRGFQGSAKAWNAGAKVARYFTAYDHDAFRQNIEEALSTANSAATAAANAQSDIDAHLAETVTDATKNPHGAFTEFADRAVNVKWFGAVGDGVTDDTEAILNAINVLGENGGIVVVPAGTYLYNQTLVINNGKTIVGVGGSHDNGSILLYNGNNSAVDIDSSGALKQITIKKYHNGWDGWNPASPVSGVRMVGLNGRIEDVTIWGFEVGLHFIGENKGCAYNQAFLRGIRNCLVAIKLDATNNGWVNENSIYGGRIHVDSNLRDATWAAESWGIYMDCHTTNYPNNNKFIGISIEGVNNGVRIVGMYNTFLDPRIEIPGTVKVVFKNLEDSTAGLCRYNWIFGLHGNNTFGTNILVKSADDTDVDDLVDNMIIGRSSGNLPLQMTNDSLSFPPSYRQAMIKYNITNFCFEFWHGGNKIATLDQGGNLKIKGTVSENQTF